MLVNLQREAVKIAISMNPTRITVHRKRYVPDDGGRRIEESVVGSADVLLYSRMTLTGESTSEAGRQQVAHWYALAPHDLLVEYGSDVVDYFDVEITKLNGYFLHSAQPTDYVPKGDSQTVRFVVKHAQLIGNASNVAGRVLQLEEVT